LGAEAHAERMLSDSAKAVSTARSLGKDFFITFYSPVFSWILIF